MTFPLFDYITPLSARPDPNGGVANGMAGIQSFTDAKRHKADQAQQNSQFQQKFGLEANDQLMRGDAQQHEQRKDAVSLLGKYNEFLANGDDASAAGLAPALKALGVDLSPSDAPGQSPQDWHAQQSAPVATPDAVSGAQGAPQSTPVVPPPQTMPEAPPSKADAPFKARPVPPLLSKFMAAMPHDPEPPADQLGEIPVEGHDEPPIQATPPAAPTQAPQVPGGLPKYQVSYRGEDLGVIDPNLYHAQNKAAAGRVGGAFLGSLPDSVSEGFAPGLEVPATGKEAKDAVNNDLLLTLQGMRSKGKGGGKGGAAGGTGLEGILADPKEAARLDMEVRQWTSLTGQDNGLKALNQVATDAAKSATLLNPDEPLANRLAVAQTIKSMFGAAASEGERGFILGGEGMLTKLQMDLNNWVSGGVLPANFKSALQAIANRAKTAANGRAQMLAEHGADAILQNPLVGGRLPPALKPAVKRAIMTGLSAETGMVDVPSDTPPKRPEFLK